MILDKSNNIVQRVALVNQQKDTSSVFKWCSNIKKESSFFIAFYIESIYSPVSENLFKNAIQFAKYSLDISDYKLLLINQARKTLLFNEYSPWVKKEATECFDVLMGCFEEAV